MKNKSNKIILGSGNVFQDLGVENAEELKTKSGLVYRIASLISERNLTQVQAAKLLKIDQPKISQLLSGNLDGFSTERIFRFLLALDQEIEIRVRTRLKSRRKGKISLVVETA